MIELVSSEAAFGPVSSISYDIVLAPAPAPIFDTSEDSVSKLKHIFCKGLNLTHP
jgi:hypothetical protein